MQTLSGYLESYECINDVIVARFLTGTSEPDPEGPPVLTLTLESDDSSAQVLDLLKRLKEADDWLYLYYSPGAPLQIESEFGDEYSIQHPSLNVKLSAYECSDFARLARVHYADANKQRALVHTQKLHLARIREMISEQCTRIDIKSQGHAAGTTARTLYEQQLSFLRRLLLAAEA